MRGIFRDYEVYPAELRVMLCDVLWTNCVAEELKRPVRRLTLPDPDRPKRGVFVVSKLGASRSSDGSGIFVPESDPLGDWYMSEEGDRTKTEQEAVDEGREKIKDSKEIDRLQQEKQEFLEQVKQISEEEADL